uniref:DAGKc domain-containing protein n=1 Tax=Panagrolaimus sp. PS1159 TaxID=55785 RepID=A0AC35FPE3_9BILA
MPNPLCKSCCHGTDVAPALNDLSIIDFPNGSLLIFINPHSGAGKGLHVFEKELKPKLLKFKIKHEIIVTERANHAKEIIKLRNDLFDFNAIIIVSGDGLIFEVINGILERSDGEEVLKKVAFGIVPSGSGNGLLASVFHARNLPQTLPEFATTAYSIISDLKAQAFPINFTHIETDDEHFASFLSIGWGLLADIDIESERYRKILGGNRFVLGAFVRVFGSLRTYKGRLSFHEAGPSETIQPETFPVYNQSNIITDQYPPSYRSHKSTIDSLTSPSIKSSKQNPMLWRQHHKGEAPLLEDSLPINWTVIEDEFLFVYVTSLSHISPGNLYSPSSKLFDDRIQLTYALKKDVPSKIAVMKFLDSIENGKHLEFDFCKTISVTSFRLEPLVKGSYIVVDGEIIETSKIQGTVSDLNFYVMSK